MGWVRQGMLITHYVRGPAQVCVRCTMRCTQHVCRSPVPQAMVTHSLPSSPTLEQTETWQHKHVCSHCFSLFKQVIYVVINTTSQDINIYSFSDKNSILIQKKKLFDMLLLNLHFLMLFLVKISDKEKSSSSNIMREIMRKILMIIRLD